MSSKEISINKKDLESLAYLLESACRESVLEDWQAIHTCRDIILAYLVGKRKPQKNAAFIMCEIIKLVREYNSKYSFYYPTLVKLGFASNLGLLSSLLSAFPEMDDRKEFGKIILQNALAEKYVGENESSDGDDEEDQPPL